ncbi:MAG TPA: preprotein translocase subunit SecE [Candidatus Paceibacterota bacterium]|jgi:preprotein translocase SecE subunit|nr:preprotein translocase subunit SecE [Candidatus Paceibacterota bacterium]
MKLLDFFKETKAEMRHVIWPTRRRALIYGIVVIVFSVALGYLLGGFDTLFRTVLKGIFGN